MKHFKRIGLALADCCFPPRCACCGERIAGGSTVCEGCEQALRTLILPHGVWRSRQDADARAQIPWADEAAVYAYAGQAKEGILAMKDGNRDFARHVAPLLAERVREICDPQEIGCITWVPVSRKRRRMQGYAHAEMLGRALAAELGCPADGSLLTELHADLRQHTLERTERAVFSQIFRTGQRRLHGETVLLCDDVLTTGNTLRRCTELLRQAGAGTVYAAVAACAGTQQTNTSE